MTKLHTTWFGVSALVTLVPIISVPALADDYAEARAELVAAYRAQDYDAMVAAQLSDNGLWNRFGAENQLPDGLSRPIILMVGLTSN